MSVNRNIAKEKPKKAALYVRVSTSYQADKDSLPMQRQELVAYAKLMFDIEDYVIFEDAGYSGKNTDRPEFAPENLPISYVGKLTVYPETFWTLHPCTRN